jgi:hypothetical protein
MKPEYIEGPKALENSIFHSMKVARQISITLAILMVGVS